MPYEAILPIIMEPVAEGDVPYTILYPDMPTSLEDLQRAWIQLKGERETPLKPSFMQARRRHWSSRDNFMRRGA